MISLFYFSIGGGNVEAIQLSVYCILVTQLFSIRLRFHCILFKTLGLRAPLFVLSGPLPAGLSQDPSQREWGSYFQSAHSVIMCVLYQNMFSLAYNQWPLWFCGLLAFLMVCGHILSAVVRTTSPYIIITCLT